MNKCPYLQWFDASNFEQSYETGGYTLLDMLYWARSMEGQALILAKNGQVEESKMILYTLRESIDKLIIPGQELSASLTAMAMDNFAATGFISIQVLSRQAFSKEDLSRISSFSKIKIPWAKSLLDVASYVDFKDLEDCQKGILNSFFNNSLYFNDSLPIITKQIVNNSKIVRCAMMISETGKYIKDINNSFEWMRTVPDSEKDSYAWHEAHSILLQESPDFMQPYMRILRNCSLWRIVLAMNYIYRYYEDNGVLPDGIEPGIKEWPLDPFEEQPMRYKKTGENSFIIYSVGPDEEDNNGERLWVSGPISVRPIEGEKAEDVRYHILLQ